MSTEDHLISPPDELLEDWWQETQKVKPERWVRYLADRAAHWGYKQGCAINEVELQKARDQELEACINAILVHPGFENPELFVELLRTARRPKPPSLKEQAQRILVENGTTLDGRMELDPDDIAIIRRALERLRKLEEGNE